MDGMAVGSEVAEMKKWKLRSMIEQKNGDIEKLKRDVVRLKNLQERSAFYLCAEQRDSIATQLHEADQRIDYLEKYIKAILAGG